MPIAKIQLQDGRIAKFEVPEGTTPDQVVNFAQSQFGNQQPQQPRQPTQPQQYVENQNQEPITQKEALLTTATNFPLIGARGKALTSAGVAKLSSYKPVAKTAEFIARQFNDKYSNLNPEVLKDRSYADLYDEALSNELSKLRASREQFPKSSFATQLASDVITGGAALKKLGLAGNTAKQALAGGGIIGGATAVGETQDLTNIPQSVSDLGAGATVGAIGGLAGQQIGKGIGKLSQTLPQTIKQFKGKQTPENVLSKVISPEEAGQQATKLASKIEQGRITALPEQGDEAILGFTRLLSKTQGSNKIITEYINTKSATSNKRVADLINNKLSSESYFDSFDNITKIRKDLATPLYETARREGDKALQEAMSMPTANIKDARVGRIRELVNDDRIKNIITKARQDYGINKDIPDISIESLHGARQVVDDIINTAKRSGENNKARSYLNLKQQLNNVIYDVAPTMKEADKTFAGYSALRNAQEEGLNIGKLRNGEEVKRYLKTLTDGEKETYKIGVKDYLMDKAMKTGDANSAAKKVFSQQLERDKLKAVFNNPKEFADFGKRMSDEIRVFDTKQRIVGGSRTDFNLQEGSELLDKVVKGAINIKTFGIPNIILTATDAIKKRYYGLNEQLAKELAKIIVSPQKSVEVLNRIYQKAQTKEEKMLIQKFADNLSKKNFTAPISSKFGQSMATEQIKEENNNGI